MNIKRLVSDSTHIKGVGLSHVPDAFSRSDYEEFIDVVRAKLSSAKWSAAGETEFDLKFKDSNFSISAYLRGLTISVVVKFLDDRFMFLSVAGFACKLGILETSDTEGLYTMFTERDVQDSVLRSFQKVYSLEDAYVRLYGGGSVDFSGLRMFVSGEQLSFDNVMYGSVPFPPTFEGFKKAVSEYKNRKG